MKTPLERAATLVEQQYKRNQEAVRLAKLASLAVRVESHLLRRLRLELLPDADVGIEADLWFSPLVESRGVRAIVLNRYVIELLREKLAEDRQLLRRVIVLTEQAHAESAKTIRLEERLTAIAVLNEDDAQQQIDEALRPALRTLLAGGEDARQLAQWAMRALPQAHRSVRESPNAIALGLSATLALGGRPILRDVPKLTGDLGDITWLLRAAISGSPTRIGVELVAEGVAFSAAGGEQPQLELPATNPLVVALGWKTDDGDAQMLVEAAPGRTVELDAAVTQVELRTLNGDEYLLSAVSAVESSSETTSEDLGARNFDIDVYISYAHVDNEQRLKKKGWVTIFHETLRHLVEQGMARPVKTWMDQRFETATELSKTALFVSVLTPGYLKSVKCMDELELFCDLAEQTRGVVVDGKSRVIKVIKKPIDIETQSLPLGLRNTLGYNFFEIDDYGKPVEFDPAVGREYYEKFFTNAEALSNDIVQMLTRLSEEPPPLRQPPAKKFSGIFISYRHGDSAREVRRLSSTLIDHFGMDRIFMDIHSIGPGEDIREAINNAVRSCEILIAIIGPHWLEGLNNPSDMVRLEIAPALSRDIPVIPVLVQGASMPERHYLPGNVATLAQRQSIELSDSRWQFDVDVFIRMIDQVLAGKEEVAVPRRGVRKPDLPIEVSTEEERRLHYDARRFARLLVSEMKLYNEPKVMEGRKKNNIYKLLREDIDRSREMYDKRVKPMVAARYDYFHEELVNTLAEGDARKMGPDYPGPKLPMT